MTTTKTIYKSPEIVPCRRPKGDLDSRYTPQVYSMVRNWANMPAEYGEGALATYRFPAVQLGYQLKGTRVVLVLVPLECETEDVVLTDTVLRTSLSTGEVMSTLQDAWQNIPVLNP